MKGYQRRRRKASGDGSGQVRPGGPAVLPDDLVAAVVGESSEDLCQEGLDALARQGARVLLEAGMEAEVTEFLGRLRYGRGAAPTGYRNGHRHRRLTCGSGAFEVRLPKVTGAPEPFERKTLKAYERTSPMIQEVMPLLYAEGLSTRDFERALGPFWQEAGLSRSSVSRANRQLYEAFDAWRKRDLSGLRVLYLFLDGYHERVRFGSKDKEGVLVAHAILADGRRELLGMALGPKESTEAWKAVLDGLKARGLGAPALVISDGAPGLIAAIRAAWPQVPRQRCIAHKTWNVLARVPRRLQAEVERDLKPVFYAPCLDEAKAAAAAFLAKWGERLPTACENFARDLEDCLTFYRFPEAHWKRIRTSNVLERTFKEVRRRTRVVGRFPTERSALVLIWASIEQDRLRWRGVKMTPDLLEAAETATEELSQEPLVIECARKYLDAA